MKNYFLIILASDVSEKQIEKIGFHLAPIVDSPELKFSLNEGSAILHFSSDVHKIELFDFIRGAFYGTFNSYFLLETDNVSYNMTKELEAHLLNLENTTENRPFETDSEEFSEDFVEFLLEEFDKEVKVPSLNELLDKIHEKGISSLTEREKQILDNYSKN